MTDDLFDKRLSRLADDDREDDATRGRAKEQEERERTDFLAAFRKAAEGPIAEVFDSAEKNMGIKARGLALEWEPVTSRDLIVLRATTDNTGEQFTLAYQAQQKTRKILVSGPDRTEFVTLDQLTKPPVQKRVLAFVEAVLKS